MCSAGDPEAHSRMSGQFTKEPYISANEPSIPQKKYNLEMSFTFPQNSHTRLRLSPAYSGKRIFTNEPFISAQKSCTFANATSTLERTHFYKSALHLCKNIWHICKWDQHTLGCFVQMMPTFPPKRTCISAGEKNTRSRTKNLPMSPMSPTFLHQSPAWLQRSLTLLQKSALTKEHYIYAKETHMPLEKSPVCKRSLQRSLTLLQKSALTTCKWATHIRKRDLLPSAKEPCISWNAPWTSAKVSKEPYIFEKETYTYPEKRTTCLQKSHIFLHKSQALNFKRLRKKILKWNFLLDLCVLAHTHTCTYREGIEL